MKRPASAMGNAPVASSVDLAVTRVACLGDSNTVAGGLSHGRFSMACLDFSAKVGKTHGKTHLVGDLVAFFLIFADIGLLIIPTDSYFSEGWPNHQPGI